MLGAQCREDFQWQQQGIQFHPLCGNDQRGKPGRQSRHEGAQMLQRDRQNSQIGIRQRFI